LILRATIENFGPCPPFDAVSVNGLSPILRRVWLVDQSSKQTSLGLEGVSYNHVKPL
jgi:hypothetical protein